MPISKTCYFCEKENCKNCKPFCSTFGYAYVICDNCNGFTPNADWLYIEGLEKENEELKRKIQSYKYEREKLHGYLAKSEVNPVQKTFKVGDSITPEDWERGRTVNGKIYHFKLTNGQKVICKKTVYKCLSEPEIEFFEITEIEEEAKE